MNKKRVLITGGDGFIGSHLTELLLAEGYKVRALSMYNSFNNWGWLEDLEIRKDLEIIQAFTPQDSQYHHPSFALIRSFMIIFSPD